MAVRIGGEILVNSATVGGQDNPQIIVLTDGGFVIAWVDSSEGIGGATGDVSGWGIKAQMFAADGAPVGTEILVNTATEGDQFDPELAALSDGGFVITWTDRSAGVGGAVGDSSDTAMKAQIFAASGARVGGEILVNTTTAGQQWVPKVAGLAGGKFVIVWEDNSGGANGSSDDDSGAATRAQLFASDGTRLGGEILVNTATESSQHSPHITALAGGGFVVIWEDESEGVGGAGGDTSDIAVKAQVFTADGVAVGTEILVNSATLSAQYSPQITALGSGGFVVVWHDLSSGVGGATGDNSESAVKAQVFAANGTRVGSEIRVNTATAGDQIVDNWQTQVAALESGGFVVTWSDGSAGVGGTTGDAGGWAVKAQVFAADGSSVGSEILVNTATAGHQHLPNITSLVGGGFVITWADNSLSVGGATGDASGSAVKAQEFAADGTRVGGEFLVNSATENSQGPPRITALPDGGFVAVWTDGEGVGGATGDTSSSAVKAQVFGVGLAGTTPDGSHPTTVFSGPTGNSLIDAMIARTDHNNQEGDTGIKWGGEVGTGVTLAYSFIGPASVFAADYLSEYTDDVRALPQEVQDAYRQAFAYWSQVTNVTFIEVTETSTNVGDIRIGATGSRFSVGQAIAEAWLPSSSHAVAGDIWHSPDALEMWGWSAGDLGFTTAIHELGHAVFNLPDVSTSPGLLGAILSPDLNYRSATVMSYSVIPGATVGSPPIYGNHSYLPTTAMTLDILAAQYIYGANVAHNAGDDTYLFFPSTNYHETIWDAGGKDILDFHLLSANLEIDLTPGALSNIGTILIASPPSGAVQLTHTLGIAFGAVIESAIGGAGNDHIIGNITDNWLTGGLGDDLLDGGAGVDTAQFGILSTDATWERSDNGWTVVSAEGTDALIRIERLHFLDQTIVLKLPTNDFTGDGTSDVLWLQTSTNTFGAFEMDTGSALFDLYATAGGSWEIVGTGDFTGDGTSDILWREIATNQFGAFVMDTGSAIFSLYATAGAGWEVAGTGDFTGDGTSDILWREIATNQFGAFEMDTGSATFDVYGTAGAGWELGGTGDYTGDGRTDILWRETATNQFGAFEMDTGSATFDVYGTAGAGWELV